MSVDRYLAIYLHLRYEQVVTEKEKKTRKVEKDSKALDCESGKSGKSGTYPSNALIS